MKVMWPFRHFGLKVLSLGLAVLLWTVIAGEETVERGLRVFFLGAAAGPSSLLRHPYTHTPTPPYSHTPRRSAP